MIKTNPALVSIGQAIGSQPGQIPVSRTTIWNWIQSGKIPTVKLGKRVFIKREVLDLLLDQGLEAVTEQQA